MCDNEYLAHYVVRERIREAEASSALRALLREKRALDRGHSLILFPEGTRGSGAAPARFKPGLHCLAHDYPGVELVPVYLTNLARAYPKGAIVPAPISCVVSFGDPLALEPGEAKPHFLERCRQAVCTLGGVS